MPFKTNPKFYAAWKSMKARCYNQNNKQYADYGGRGIRVCPRWKSDYKAFESDMGDRPEGYSLDRIDNDKDYSPGNCRWANRTTQQRNQRRAVYVLIAGVRYRAIELADLSGQKTDTIVERAARGLSYEDVVRTDRLRDLSGLALGGRASGEKKRQLTHCKRGHEFTPENTVLTPQGWRVCRTCHNGKKRRLEKQWRAERV